MAQSEDTELRDLVVEALEKNGSLAQIRATLRANVFLAFEQIERQHQKSNLDYVVNSPEGILCLSLIHDFLEYCELKNTLFVYTSESRQGNGYNLIGKKQLDKHFHTLTGINSNEPMLMSIVRSIVKRHQKFYDQGDGVGMMLKDDQNCTYIVNEDSSNVSSTTTTSPSDHSSDEKHKLQLRLNLEHSDTDTSTDSARDKSRSEYIANKHILARSNIKPNSELPSFYNVTEKPNQDKQASSIHTVDSLSYINMKPLSLLDRKLLNTTGVPHSDNHDETDSKVIKEYNVSEIKKKCGDSQIFDVNITRENDSIMVENAQNSSNIKKAGVELVPKSQMLVNENIGEMLLEKDRIQLNLKPENSSLEAHKENSPESHHKSLNSTQSSVSISDIADLLEMSDAQCSPTNKQADESNNLHKLSEMKKNQDDNKCHSDHSDFTASPIPSVSNLSLDYNSD